MKIADCPTWLCNEYGVPYDIFYFLSFLLLAIPYLWLIAYLYKQQKIGYSQKKAYIFYLLAPVGFFLYFVLLFFLFMNAHSPVLTFLAAVAYGSIMWLMMLMPVTIAIVLLSFARNNIGGR